MARRARTDAASGSAEPRAQRRGDAGPHTVHERSAGGIVVSAGGMLLIATQEGRRWQLPKGHIEAGETATEAAVREVREETGVTGEVVAALPSIEYWYVEKGGAQRIHKRVDFFLLAYRSGDPRDFDAKEVSGAAWFPWEQGIGQLSFPSERQVAVAAHRMIVEHEPAPPGR